MGLAVATASRHPCGYFVLSQSSWANVTFNSLSAAILNSSLRSTR